MTKAEEFEREKRLIRVQRKVVFALNQVSEKFTLNFKRGTVEARDAGNALDEAMFNFVEGSASLEEVEAAFKDYIRAIIAPASDVEGFIEVDAMKRKRELRIESKTGNKTFIDIDTEKFLMDLKEALCTPGSQRTINACIEAALNKQTQKQKIYIEVSPQSI